MLHELFDLSGKTAIVTGAGQGLGKGMAAGLAEAGARVVIADIRGELAVEAANEIRQRSGRDVIAKRVDVTNQADVERLVAETWALGAPVDILVNNVGGSQYFPNVTFPVDAFEDVFRVCVTSALMCSQAVARRWIEAGRGGKIVNVGSIYGSLGTDLRIYDFPDAPFEGHIAFTAAKGALVNFTRDLACTWARYGICVNCISPGPMQTEAPRPEPLLRRLRDRIPLGRLGTPKDLVGAVVLLASPASDFITGQDVVVDGGFSAW